MPEKPLTVATYAAGASLAAITLIYVFAPTYLLDSDTTRSGSSRKRGVVGLSNPANDCFINSILQALAGLGDLRLYLIRETHRRSLDDAACSVYAVPVPHADLPEWKILSLQSGAVTAGLKRILDQLNERPISKKTASALPFVRELELAFRQRISRQQQDAQEFLQVVAERLCDEYHAGRRARAAAKRRQAGLRSPEDVDEVHRRLAGLGAEPATPVKDKAAKSGDVPPTSPGPPASKAEAPGAVEGPSADSPEVEDEDEDGFPMEGRFESQIECLTCGFKPRPKEDSFCTLTLNVPQMSSTTLNACFDGMFKTEYIDDFKCEKCRLLHAKSVYEVELSRLSPEADHAAVAAKQRAIAQLQSAIDTDPERTPEDVALPDARYAPKRRIARHIRMTSFPKILAVHLSRSIYEKSQSQKNSAKVAFPERLPLGGLLHRRRYKLLGVVAHKGSHHSGHYESFRRQNVYPPYSTPNAFGANGVYGRSAPATPANSTPRIAALQKAATATSPTVSTPDLSLGGAASSGTTSGSSDAGSAVRPSSSTSKPRDKDPDASSLRSVARSTLSRIASSGGRSASKRRGDPAGQQDDYDDDDNNNNNHNHNNNNNNNNNHDNDNEGAAKEEKRPLSIRTKHRGGGRKKGQDNMWWRLSDEKVKEATTKDVLGMQREVYLLFYEMEKHPA